MTDVGRIFEEAETLMHAAVDQYLGDVVEVSNNGGAWTERHAFVFDEGGVLNLAAIDAADFRIRIKIRREYAPLPSQARFRGGKLGDRIWRATGDVPENVGLYRIFDMSPTAA